MEHTSKHENYKMKKIQPIGKGKDINIKSENVGCE
jgi:hypothetical protein